jgi:hypothetical protein
MNIVNEFYFCFGKGSSSPANCSGLGSRVMTDRQNGLVSIFEREETKPSQAERAEL